MEGLFSNDTAFVPPHPPCYGTGRPRPPLTDHRVAPPRSPSSREASSRVDCQSRYITRRRHAFLGGDTAEGKCSEGGGGCPVAGSHTDRRQQLQQRGAPRAPYPTLIHSHYSLFTLNFSPRDAENRSAPRLKTWWTASNWCRKPGWQSRRRGTTTWQLP